MNNQKLIIYNFEPLFNILSEIEDNLNFKIIKLEEKNYDFFIFGHRHLPIEHVFENGAKYINLGDWIQHNTYAVFSKELVELKKFEMIN